MVLQKIINNSNLYTDENLEDSSMLSFANSAIAKINTTCKTNFPEFASTVEDYTSFPDKWLMSMISPFMSYSVKVNDSSLNEADRFFQSFMIELDKFENQIYDMTENYENGDTTNGINPELIDEDGNGGIYEMDTSGAINIGFFGEGEI